MGVPEFTDDRASNACHELIKFYYSVAVLLGADPYHDYKEHSNRNELVYQSTCKEFVGIFELSTAHFQDE